MWSLLIFLNVLAELGPSQPPAIEGEEASSEVGEGVTGEPSLQLFEETLHHDYPLRNIGLLQVSNRWGQIIVRGWSQDKIRVRVHRSVRAASEAEARLALERLSIRYSDRRSRIEISATVGKDSGIESKLKQWQDREEEREGRLNLEVLAPSKLELEILAHDSGVKVESWSSRGAGVSVRAAAGSIQVKEVTTDQLKVTCPECPVEIEKVNGSLRVVGGKGQILVKEVVGSEAYFQSDSGLIQASNIESDQIYVTSSGTIQAKRLKGKVHFQSDSGEIEVLDSRGFVTGRSGTGNILLEMKSWVFEDKAFIESETGDIQITFPSNFSAEIDLESVMGKTFLEFPLKQGLGRGLTSGFGRSQEVSSIRLKGRIGERGGDDLRVFSNRGNIRVLKWD